MTGKTGRFAKVLAVLTDNDEGETLAIARGFAERHGASLSILGCVEPRHLGMLARLSGRRQDQVLAELRERKEAEIGVKAEAALPGLRHEKHVAVGRTFQETVRHVLATGCDFVIKPAEPLEGAQRFLFSSTDQHLLRKCPCPVWLVRPGTPIAPKRVVAGVDVDLVDAAEPETLASLNRRVLQAAQAIASGPGAEIVVLHAWEALAESLLRGHGMTADAREAADGYVEEVLATRREAMRRLLIEASGEGASDGPRLEPHFVRGAPEQAIGKETASLRADAVVLGTVARVGVSGVFIGNTAENIINSLECSVVAVKPDGFVSPLAP